jgi:hypothetical protein
MAGAPRRNMHASETMWRTLHADAFCLARDLNGLVLTGQPPEVQCSALTAFELGGYNTGALPGCTEAEYGGTLASK